MWVRSLLGLLVVGACQSVPRDAQGVAEAVTITAFSQPVSDGRALLIMEVANRGPAAVCVLPPAWSSINAVEQYGGGATYVWGHPQGFAPAIGQQSPNEPILDNGHGLVFPLIDVAPGAERRIAAAAFTSTPDTWGLRIVVANCEVVTRASDGDSYVWTGDVLQALPFYGQGGGAERIQLRIAE